MTGAPVPGGADTVVRVEDTDGGASSVEIRDARDAGQERASARRGHRRRAASPSPPARRSAPRRSACSRRWDSPRWRSCALRASRSSRRATNSSSSTGFDEVRAGRKIVSSNGYTLRALVRACRRRAGLPRNRVRHAGVAARDCSSGPAIVRHDHHVGGDLRGRARLHARRARGDGRGDEVLARADAARRAASASACSTASRGSGCPGNPVSTMVTFELFARPAIQKMRGHAKLFRRPGPGRARRAGHHQRGAHAFPARRRHGARRPRTGRA